MWLNKNILEILCYAWEKFAFLLKWALDLSLKGWEVTTPTRAHWYVCTRTTDTAVLSHLGLYVRISGVTHEERVTVAASLEWN